MKKDDINLALGCKGIGKTNRISYFIIEKIKSELKPKNMNKNRKRNYGK